VVPCKTTKAEIPIRTESDNIILKESFKTGRLRKLLFVIQFYVEKGEMIFLVRHSIVDAGFIPGDPFSCLEAAWARIGFAGDCLGEKSIT
jgi:hypothetical protein